MWCARMDSGFGVLTTLLKGGVLNCASGIGFYPVRAMRQSRCLPLRAVWSHFEMHACSMMQKPCRQMTLIKIIVSAFAAKSAKSPAPGQAIRGQDSGVSWFHLAEKMLSSLGLEFP